MTRMQYCEAILAGFEYVMENDPKCLTIGQGLWSPWYVGRSMDGLDKKFGVERVIDTPVSEQATTGMAVGASLNGYRPIVIHPRMDFMILATDQIVNQAAKWHHMLGGGRSPSMVVRGIVNRGGEQGAQHSQALHSWYAHVPGLRVVMPATPSDARDLLIAAVQSPDPVLYIDDRWLYEWEDDVAPPQDLDLSTMGPQVLREGTDLTIGAASFSVRLALDCAEILQKEGISCEVVDARILNPFDPSLMRKSARKTGRFLAVDGGWANCGFASEMITCVVEHLHPSELRCAPSRVTLPSAPAPTSRPLEEAYYPTAQSIAAVARQMVTG